MTKRERKYHNHRKNYRNYIRGITEIMKVGNGNDGDFFKLFEQMKRDDVKMVEVYNNESYEVFYE